MNLTGSELSNRPEILYVQLHEIGVSKKVNPLKNIPGSATDRTSQPKPAISLDLPAQQ
ncbi:hypothetical protein Hanom_Chr06g00565791 [Helianthus anomalus]